jgi:rhodanese-related sulfurtransferase
MNSTISQSELRRLLSSASVKLIDVMLPEDYAACHITGAENACVYEMVFLERVSACVPDHGMAVVVYDTSGTSLTARTAREKLVRAGYHSVAVLEGGLRAWQADGLPVESSEETPVVIAVPDGWYRVDVSTSVIEWSGRNINNRHHGRISLAGGAVVFDHGKLQGGNFVIDMHTIQNLDIQDNGWRSMLLRHLCSDDFFDVECYPTTALTVTGWKPIEGASPGTPNGIISADLAIKDITAPVSFPAMIVPQEDGSIKAQAAFDIDRTIWNVLYGSGRLFEKLGMHLVNDLISFELFLVARA